jgi:hypothetical protein
MLFVKLLGGNEAIAAKMYLALDTARAKTQVLEQLTESIEDERCRAVTRAVMSISKTREKERDKLVHRALGICDELQDAFLVINAKDIVTKAQLHFDDVLVYRETDFLSIVSGNMRLCDYLSHLQEVLKKPRSQKGDQLLDELYRTPEIQERLGRPVSPARSAQGESS